jgi:hypothetical protein
MLRFTTLQNDHRKHVWYGKFGAVNSFQVSTRATRGRQATKLLQLIKEGINADPTQVWSANGWRFLHNYSHVASHDMAADFQTENSCGVVEIIPDATR